MKPKLWNGPDAVAEARARFNETIDVPYVTASGRGFRAHKKIGLSEIFLEHGEVEGKELVLFADGYAGTKFKRKGSERINSPFLPSLRDLRFWNLGDGYGCDVYASYTFHEENIPVSPLRNGTGMYQQLFTHWGYSITPKVYKKSEVSAFPLEFRTMRQSISTIGDTIYSMAVLGKGADGDKGRFLFVIPQEVDAVDGWEWNVVGAAIHRVFNDGKSMEIGLLPLPDEIIGNRDIVLGNGFTFGPSGAGLFVGVMPYITKELPGGDILASTTVTQADANGQGALFVYKTDDAGLTWEILRFPGLDILVAYDEGTEPILGFKHYDNRPTHWASIPGAVDTQGVRLSDFVMTHEIVVFSPSVWVVFASVTDGRHILGTLIYGRSLAWRTADAGQTWSEVTTPLTGGYYGGNQPLYLFDACVLRPGVAIARAVTSFVGIDRVVKWLKTEDEGETWEEFLPFGLPSNLNQYIGYPKVLRVTNENGQDKTLIGLVCWSAAKSSYVMFLSEDDGSTWVAGKRVATAPYFRRVDRDRIVNPSNDGEGNFGILDYRGTERNPVPLDIALPWRFDGTTSQPA